ncbi:hypothetical protein [Corynebacterium diphtheriae]|uniref:hypothetical protein n=2 Tax=Corynebacterium diphtheriae TaxID=1717 RepID=UPI001A7E07FB|nr:hypothetical protein [Corynebacterium diphtheriae]
MCSLTELPSSIPSAAPQNTVIVTVIEAESVEPIEPHKRAAWKAMSKRRKDTLAYIRHTINAL